MRSPDGTKVIQVGSEKLATGLERQGWRNCTKPEKKPDPKGTYYTPGGFTGR
jgi:hypothetical protein